MSGLRALGGLCAFLLALALVATEGGAYVLSRTPSGQALSWRAPAAPVFYANWTNIRSLQYSDVFTAFTSALQRWKYSGSSSLGFDYWQGASSATPTKTEYDQRNAVFFSSQSTQKLGATTIAITYIYSVENGNEILEADVEFNDDEFTFTTVPSDSSRFGDQKHVFLENVATHEFGHALGLSHSAALQSSMVYLEYRGQAKLSCDDVHAIAALYPSTSFTSGRGAISGSVVRSGTDVFGAHVLAVSKTRGTVVSSAITQPDGSYAISNLEPGDYHLLVEPFQGSVPDKALCSAPGEYYCSINSHTICVGVPFKRGFVENGSAGAPRALAVTASATVSAGAYEASCSDMPGVPSPSTSIAAASVASPLLADTSSGSAAVDAVIGSAGAAGSAHYYRLSNISGDLAVKVLAYSLYSPFDPKVEILDPSGQTPAGAQSADNVFSDATSLYANYDSSARLAAAPAGTYYVKVTNVSNVTIGGSFRSRDYPAGNSSSQLDASRFYLLIVTAGDATPQLPTSENPALANNARCEAPDSFPPFPDHGPPSENVSSAPSSSTSSGGGASSDSGAKGCSFLSKALVPGPGPSDLFSAWGLVALLVSGRFAWRGLALAVARLASRGIRR